ncbi:MAG TPA: hypothetical protein VMU02_07930 [bacterium]|nr:hypothetical protein [bacterium]
MGAPRHVVAAMLVLLVVAGSCGRDNTVAPIDTVAPNPPVGVMTAPDGMRSVVISWDPNTEVDLAGYNLYTSTNEHGPYGQVNARLLLCPWCYAQATPMDVTYFKVTAVDRSGNESAYSQEVVVYINSGKSGAPPSHTDN